MGSRRDRSDQIRELASVIYRLMREREIDTTDRLKVSPTLSRILEHAPEYRALRRRAAAKAGRARVAKEPSFFTLVDLAQELGVPICTFAPSIEHQTITEPQRKVFTLFSRWMLGSFARQTKERAMYASDFEDFEPFVTIRKQAFLNAASPVGIDSQYEPEEADVLASIPGVRSERRQVIRVRGDSMADRIRHGDYVLVDIERRNPRNGAIVAVDRGHLGRTIGYWRREKNRFYLDKENAEPIDLGSLNDFTVTGTILGIVWSPFRA